MNARTGYWFRHFTAATIGSLFLIAAQAGHAQTKTTPLIILLSGPRGEPSTLVYSPEGGWRLHAGWNSADTEVGTEPSIKAAMATQPALLPEERPMLERPLTVFLDGPTGFTYIYLFDKGWKFVGRIAQERR
jgi:hypothetical protein